MPAATEVQAAAKALARAARRVASDGASRYESLSEYADMMAAIHRRAALSLELRKPCVVALDLDNPRHWQP